MANEAKETRSDRLITVTPPAVEELKRLLADEEDKSVFLRIGISSGGCSGFSYAMQFDNNPSETDREFDFDGVRVRVDMKSLAYLAGSTLDYKGGLLGGGFTFENPNAKRSCGCGSSFSC